MILITLVATAGYLGLAVWGAGVRVQRLVWAEQFAGERG
jgi:hypothetical protein